MITYRRLTIPIFDIILKIYIFDEQSELENITGDQRPSKGLTFTSDNYNPIGVAIDSHHPSTIVHEAEHVKNYIWANIGYTPQRDNDEVDAYLLKYIYNKIADVFYKHIGKNPKDLFG